MTRTHYILVAGGGSAALLLGAFAFQYLGGMAPCEMCLWQRWPHGVAVGIALLALVWSLPALALAGALAALSSSVLGFYHTGVERAWWQGPSSCSSGSVSGISATDLMDRIMSAPLVRCDEVAWEMFGLSMASWNALASLALALVWVLAFRQTARA